MTSRVVVSQVYYVLKTEQNDVFSLYTKKIFPVDLCSIINRYSGPQLRRCLQDFINPYSQELHLRVCKYAGKKRYALCGTDA